MIKKKTKNYLQKYEIWCKNVKGFCELMSLFDTKKDLNLETIYNPYKLSY